MLARLQRLYAWLANPWLALGFGLLAGLFFAILAVGLGKLPPNAPGILDLQLSFRAERLGEVLNAWGEAGVRQYVNSMWLDYLYPLAYSLALASLLAWETSPQNQAPRPWQLLLFSLPLLAGIFDYVENSLHLLMFAYLQTLPPVLVFLSALAASLKWALIAVSGFAAILLPFLRRK